MQKKVIVLALCLLFSLSFVNANWMLLDNKGNEIQNGDAVSTNKIELKLSGTETPNFLYKLIRESKQERDEIRKFNRICESCEEHKEYSKVIGTNNKEENYILQIILGNELIERVFTIDNRAPLIKDIYPDSRLRNSKERYSNGQVVLTIIDQNLQTAKLHSRHASSGDWQQTEMVCETLGDTNNCQASFPGNDGDEFYFYFTAIDSAGNSAQSKESFTIIDTTAPQVEILSPTTEQQDTTFLLTIGTNEESEILYNIDNQQAGVGLRYTKICSDCTFGSRRIMLSEGNHMINIKVVNRAGLESIQSTNVEIINF